MDELDLGILQELVGAAVRSTGADRGALQLVVGSQQKLQVAAQVGFSPVMLAEYPPSDPSDTTSVTGRVATTRQRVVIRDVHDPGTAYGYRLEAAKIGFRGIQGTPLISRRGRVLGVLVTNYAEPITSMRALPLVDMYARIASALIESRRPADEIKTRNGPDHPALANRELDAAVQALRDRPTHLPTVQHLCEIVERRLYTLIAELERLSQAK